MANEMLNFLLRSHKGDKAKLCINACVIILYINCVFIAFCACCFVAMATLIFHIFIIVKVKVGLYFDLDKSFTILFLGVV